MRTRRAFTWELKREAGLYPVKWCNSGLPSAPKLPRVQFMKPGQISFERQRARVDSLRCQR